MKAALTTLLLLVVLVGASLLSGGDPPPDGDTQAGSEGCDATCSCHMTPPPLPPAEGEKGLPETDPAGKLPPEGEDPEY